jgi:hypothetical protein
MDTAAKMGEVIMSAAALSGAVVVEYLRCPSCKVPQHQVHRWAEKLPCLNPECGHTFASQVPPLPKPGEATKMQLDFAMDTLRSCYANQQETTLPPLSREEVDALPVETKLLLARQSVASSRHVLDKVVGIAEALVVVR